MRPQSIKTRKKEKNNNMHQHFVLWSSIITTLLSFLTTPPPELLNADNSHQNELFLTSITHEQTLSLINRPRDTLSTIQHPSCRGPRTKKTKLSNIDVFAKWTDENLFSFTRMTRAKFLEVYFRTKNDIQKPRIYSSLVAGKKLPTDTRNANSPQSIVC